MTQNDTKASIQNQQINHLRLILKHQADCQQGSNDFKKSPKKTTAPAFGPITRSALVVPEFPLPYFLISILCVFRKNNRIATVRKGILQ